MSSTVSVSFVRSVFSGIQLILHCKPFSLEIADLTLKINAFSLAQSWQPRAAVMLAQRKIRVFSRFSSPIIHDPYLLTYLIQVCLKQGRTSVPQNTALVMYTTTLPHFQHIFSYNFWGMKEVPDLCLELLNASEFFCYYFGAKVNQ